MISTNLPMIAIAAVMAIIIVAVVVFLVIKSGKKHRIDADATAAVTAQPEPTSGESEEAKPSAKEGHPDSTAPPADDLAAVADVETETETAAEEAPVSPELETAPVEVEKPAKKASAEAEPKGEATAETEAKPVASDETAEKSAAESDETPAAKPAKTESKEENAAQPAAAEEAAPEDTPVPAPVEPEPTPAEPAPATPEPEPAAPAYEKPENSASRLVRLRAKLAKSANPLGKALFNILSRDNLSEEDWEDLEDTLLLADVGAEASENLVEQLRSDARVTGAKNADSVRAALRSRLLELVGTDLDRSLVASDPAAHGGKGTPSVIIMVGVNGTGKTTTAGKLARLFVADGKKVIMGAADTFRAAAADQLETWGKRVGVEVVRSDREGADPASVAFEAAKRAKEAEADVLIIDTAGRLQNKANLMDELGKIRRVVEKTLPVDEVLLVLDATTGQNGMTQARVFAEAIGITGIVLTKLDGSAKGGIVVSVQKELGVPVKLVGLGEGPDDLAPFDAEGFVDGILA